MADTETPKATDQPRAGSTSSTPTAESASADDPVTRLGERILAELDADRTTNTLTRWLAHHTATMIEAADQAAAAGAPDTNDRAAAARTAILQLWEHRSAWPCGWPPPRTAKLVELLDDLAAIDDEPRRKGTVLAQLQNLHYHILATMVDLATADGEPVEHGWLTQFGDQLTPDEIALLARATSGHNRVDRLIGWWEGLHADADADAGQPNDTPSHPLLDLADAYRQTIRECLQRTTRAEIPDPKGEE